MKKKKITSDEMLAFKKIVRDISMWSREHQLEIGVVEVAVGAAVLSYGVNNGLIEVGKDVLGTGTSNWAMNGAGAGGSIGGLGATFIGSIGVAGMGTAISIPASLLVGGASVVLSALGYTAGDVLHKYLHPEADFSEIFSAASTLTIGLALLIDGTRRILGDKRVRNQFSYLKGRVLYLVDISYDVVASSQMELKGWFREPGSLPGSRVSAIGSTATAAILSAKNCLRKYFEKLRRGK